MLKKTVSANLEQVIEEKDLIIGDIHFFIEKLNNLNTIPEQQQNILWKYIKKDSPNVIVTYNKAIKKLQQEFQFNYVAFFDYNSKKMHIVEKKSDLRNLIENKLRNIDLYSLINELNTQDSIEKVLVSDLDSKYSLILIDALNRKDEPKGLWIIVADRKSPKPLRFIYAIAQFISGQVYSVRLPKKIYDYTPEHW